MLLMEVNYVEKIKETTDLLKALADEHRLKIIDLLSCCGELCVCDLTEQMNLSQPNMSHHLKILKNAELIVATKCGRWVHYNLNEKQIEKMQKNLEFIVTKQPKRYNFKKSNCKLN